MNFAKYEIKLVMATLLRHFDYELVPGQEFNTQPVVALTPDGVRIRISDTDGDPTNTGPESIPTTAGEDDDESGGSQCPVH